MFKGSKAQAKVATFCFEFVSIFSMASIAIAFCFTFLFRTVVVDGSSMNPTLWDGDRLIITATTKNIEYGDIVVCSQPEIDFENGIVRVDGNILNEPYIADPTTMYEGMNFPQTVPEGCVFVMGDNRLHSTDSRSDMVGFIREDYVMGKVLFRMAPNFNLHVAEF